MVAVVSESMASKYFGGADPLGHTIVLGGRRDKMTIVGIVRDTRHESLWTEPPRTRLYTAGAARRGLRRGERPARKPHGHHENVRRYPRELIATAARAVRELSADAVMSYPRTMAQQLDASLVSERLLGTLSSDSRCSRRCWR